MIKILLVEDHNVVRDGIKSLIDREVDMRVVSETINGNEALKQLSDGLKADMVLTDINMPEINGIELTRRIKQDYPQLKVMMLTMLDHEKYVFEAFKAGVSGYILKNVSAEELVFAIRHLHSVHERYICNELSLKFMDKLAASPKINMPENLTGFELSNREIEILTLIADGYTNQEIADKMFTSKRTVEGHRQNMIDKTGTKNTAALVKFALINGLISY